MSKNAALIIRLITLLIVGGFVLFLLSFGTLGSQTDWPNLSAFVIMVIVLVGLPVLLVRRFPTQVGLWLSFIGAVFTWSFYLFLVGVPVLILGLVVVTKFAGKSRRL